jgi:large subunit ribosomal protein L23
LSLHPAEILIKPVVSEKSYHQITENRYTFKVHKDAHKTQVRQAVEELFGVTVVGVNIVKMPAKPKRRGMIKGTRPGWKKAIVQVREGDTIPIFQAFEAPE